MVSKKLGIIIVLLFATALIPVTISDAYAKCLPDHECYGAPMFFPLKYQSQFYVLPNIMCPNQDHVLTERYNGKLACVTNSTAEKTGWYIHYRNVVDTKGVVPINFPGTVNLVPFEITGATLDKMIYERQMLVVSVTPTKEYGVLSIQLPAGSLPANFKYCNPEMEDPPSTPHVVITDSVERSLNEGVNSRFQPALNIPLNENSKNIEIIRTCIEPSDSPDLVSVLGSEEFSKLDVSGKNPESCPLSSSSRCFTATMTEVIDGDLIRVNGKISLALIDAPELHEKGGADAKALVGHICPKGSEVLVDQDDLRPLEGFAGSSIPSALVYCNGLNLNEQLIKLSEVQLRSALCSTSEFADEPWARDNGCSLNSGMKNED